MTTTDRPHATLDGATVVDKPWGRETIFGVLEGQYVGKIIEVRQGHSLSCQVHHQKTETQHVLSGQAFIQYGTDPDDLVGLVFEPGQTIHLPAGVIHMISAITDLMFAEVSTAHEGWREDITRFSDAYGREGTTAQ